MRIRPSMPIEGRSKQQWESRWALALWDWFTVAKPAHGDYDLFLDEQWNLQIEIEEGLARQSA